LTEEYWYYNPIPKPQEKGPYPYNFKGYMGKKRFLTIAKCLIFTDVFLPAYRNKFWQVRQMIKALIENMANHFVAAWLMCLDESMSIWHSK
jgi:hypothetical protein